MLVFVKDSVIDVMGYNVWTDFLCYSPFPGTSLPWSRHDH